MKPETAPAPAHDQTKTAAPAQDIKSVPNTGDHKPEQTTTGPAKS